MTSNVSTVNRGEVRDKSKPSSISVPQQGGLQRPPAHREEQPSLSRKLTSSEGYGQWASWYWQEMRFGAAVSQLTPPNHHSSYQGSLKSGDSIRKLFRTNGNRAWELRTSRERRLRRSSGLLTPLGTHSLYALSFSSLCVSGCYCT